MAELGSTTDPKALIPGQPQTVHAAADKLDNRAKTTKSVADRLGDIRLEKWHGSASNAFWDKFSGEPRNWEIAQDSMHNASRALNAHADTLQWAQGQAGDAIDLWERGLAATDKAANEARANGGQTTSSGTGGPMTPGFNDPGLPMRQQAQEILDRARRQLSDAAARIARDINDAGGHGRDVPAWLSGPADFVRDHPKLAHEANKRKERSFKDIAKTKAQEAEGNRRFAKYHSFGGGAQDSQQLKATFARWQQEANLFKVDAHGATQLGDVTVAASADAKVGVGASATGYAEKGNIGGTASASAGGSASAQGGVVYGPAELNGKVRASAGAEADAGASIGTHGLNARAGGFAGGGIGADGHADVGGVGVGGSAEARVGIGAEAGVHAGMDHGKFKIGGEVGASLGIGFKVGVDIEIDPEKVADTVGDAADAIGDAAENVGDFVGDVGSALNPFD